MKRKPRVAIMTPIRHGTVHHEFASSLAATMRAIRDWDLAWFTTIGCSILPDARSMCVAQALAWGADKLVFIDDDISWTVQDFVFLCAHKQKAVTGYYCTRKSNSDDPTCITVQFKDDNRTTDESGLMEVRGAGFGFIRFDREIFDKLEPLCARMYDNALPPDVNNCYSDWFPYGLTYSEEKKAYHRAGEDIQFCHRIAELGYPLFLDPKIQLGHHAGAECFRADITKLAA